MAGNRSRENKVKQKMKIRRQSQLHADMRDMT